ncbi:hypothetical protein, partial [Marinimicrobium sp.]|uniref:hypothetical protein n=1 Tax=Marinimicrobium sp. TaxID=2024837 RepID=UPI00257E48F9
VFLKVWHGVTSFKRCPILSKKALFLEFFYSLNAIVQRQPWQSEAATRLSGGGPPGPERTGTTG